MLRSQKTLVEFKHAIKHSPKYSSTHVLALNVDEPLICHIYKNLSFHPYKIQIVQGLKDADLVACMNFCHEM